MTWSRSHESQKGDLDGAERRLGVQESAESERRGVPQIHEGPAAEGAADAAGFSQRRGLGRICGRHD